MSPAGVLAFIPSPAHGIVHIGPIPLHAYGLMLALGVVAAIYISEKRAVGRGFPPGTIGEIATVVIIAGVVGARVYHLFTGYDWSADGISGTIAIWRGGLSIWGAVGGGAIAVIYEARRKHLDTLLLCDAIGPAIAVAQAIGRWGNWFNQELFGRPTTWPWGLEIDLAHRPAGYAHFATFQPTFLYESLWCLLIFGVITLLEHRGKLRVRGQAFTLYVAMYTFERFFMELLRIDKATRIFGIRFNALLSAALCIGAVIVFVRLSRREATPVVPMTPTVAGATSSGPAVSAAEPALTVADGTTTSEVSEAGDTDGAPPTPAS
ncbi:MAG TPA: prolipoprotein diacylglyceryl transferase [Acidimicrobiia bacterium]|jgi:prolipoprotein diacylglyceryl transferase